MYTLWRDVRFTFRSLAKNWTFTVAAVTALGLGIGATSTTFSFIRPFVTGLPMVDQPDRLMFVWSANVARGTDKSVVSLPDFADWRDTNRTFDGLAVAQSATYNLSGSDQPVRVAASQVSANYFSLLGVSPQIGRTFREGEDRVGSPVVALLSHGLWQRAFGAEDRVVGRDILLDGSPATVIGVMPQGFEIQFGELWLPLTTDPRSGDRGERSAFVLGRLADGATPTQAAADLAGIAASLEADYPTTNSGWQVNPVPFSDEVLGPEFRLVLGLLGASVVLVLLIACVNVANLLLARSVERRSELALRMALGASQRRLVGQLLTESATLGLLGGIVGLAFAYGGTRLFRWMFPVDLGLIDQVGIDGTVLVFTAGVALATGLLFGLAPVWRGRRHDLRAVLNEGGRGATASGSRLRQALVVSEVAFALILLVVTGLLLRSIAGLERVPAGFDSDHLLTMRVALPEVRYPEPQQTLAFFDSVVAQVTTLPGVDSAGATSRLPIAGSRNNPIRSFEIEGRPPTGAVESRFAADLVVTPGYLAALGLPLLDGRHLEPPDTADSQLVAVISDTMATRFWGDDEPLGERVAIGDSGSQVRWLSIVGVVGDVRNDDADQPPLPQIYLPMSQHPRQAMSLLVRTNGDPMTFTTAVQQRVWRVDPDQPVYEIRTMEQILYEDTVGSRVLVAMLGVFAMLALGLFVVGIYGVVAYSASQRTREVGIRVALGAQRRDVYRLIVEQGMAPVAVGILLGAGLSLALARLLASILFQISPADPVTFIAVILILGSMALLASVIPAIRAAHVDPLVALRDE